MAKKHLLAPATVVAITGGARGIGYATASALLERGARVAIGDIDGELARASADELGSRCAGFDLEVTDRKSFAAFLDAAAARFGPIDILVNNAGIMPLGEFAEEPDELTRRIIEVNLHGVLLGTKLAIARMKPRAGGHIINISSAVGRVALAGAATYSATKYAIVGLTEATRSELRGTGVEVSCVLPMITRTELGAGLSDVRGQRTVSPEEVAKAVVATIAAPRFEVWVPASGRRLYVLMSVLPKRWAEAISRFVGAADVLAAPDTTARGEYEKRARGQR
ncbi:SDR family oxidoreductase [Nocardia callitridis]|uniref:SDR family oxidoreductase n=1 Tax=Nocardia callitridis TaxID=648753 RepID=A0ABP9KDB2_9NOCA